MTRPLLTDPYCSIKSSARIGQPIGTALAGSAWGCAEPDELALDVCVAALLLADLLRRSVGQHAAVGEQRERACRGPAEIQGVAGHVDHAAMAGEDGPAVEGAWHGVGEGDDAPHACFGRVGERASDEPRLLAERTDSSAMNESLVQAVRARRISVATKRIWSPWQ
jgi:hypothetical protein